MKKGKAGLWATIIAAGLLTTACTIGEIREEGTIFFSRDYSIGNLTVSSRDIAWADDTYKIELKGSEGEQLDITVLQRMLRDFRFFDNRGTLYKIRVSSYKDKVARESKKLFQKETGMGTLTIYERDVALDCDDYKIELKGDKGLLEFIALKNSHGLTVQFADEDGNVYRLEN